MTVINSIDVPITPTPNVGSTEDVFARLIGQLPPWFGTDHDLLNVVLTAFVNTGTFHYQQIEYVSDQTRIKTATQENLDNISSDYLGDELPRRVNESDDSYRNRILATLLQEKCTRRAMSNALFNLTGIYPRIFEPWNPANCGGYNDYTSLAYSTVGRYGSAVSNYKYQCFIDVFVDAFAAMANYNGYNSYLGGFNTVGAPAQMWYGGDSLNHQIISDSDIYKLINLTKMEGTVCWTRIHRGEET